MKKTPLFFKNADFWLEKSEIPSNSADLIVTDPPYLIPKINGGGSVNEKMKLNRSLGALNSSGLTKGYDIRAFADEVKRLQGKNINAYFWCNKAQLLSYLEIYVGEMKCKYELLCWHKKNALPTYSNKYLSDTEYCLYVHKGKGRTHPLNYEDARTWWIGQINLADKKKYGHPTIKPLDYIRQLIRNSSDEGDVIFDPFAGSGTTAVAALLERRRFVGFEINKQFYDIATSRIEEATK